MDAEVFPEAAQLSELLIAFAAFVRALTRVDSHVTVEARHCSEPLQALPARVRPFTRMLSQMRLELIRLNESPETFRTRVTLFHVRIAILLVLMTLFILSSLSAVRANLVQRFVFDNRKRFLVGF